MNTRFTLGIYIKSEMNSLTNNNSIVFGDELYAQSLAKAINKIDPTINTKYYASNHVPQFKHDLMIYFNDTPPNLSWAKKHILYLQNPYSEGSYTKLKQLREYSYDGYMFISSSLLAMHKKDGFTGIYLPFGVDTATFYPRQADKAYAYEASYIGNNFKPERFIQYLLPASQFNLGLFGEWKSNKLSNHKKIHNHIYFSLYRHAQHIRMKYLPCQSLDILYKIGQGKIPQPVVPILYSSTAINLNVTATDCVKWGVTNLRIIEILACNGFVISDVKPSQVALQKSVITTRGGEDLIKEIQYYLHHPAERQRLSQIGYRWVIAHETIERRANDLIQYVKSLS